MGREIVSKSLEFTGTPTTDQMKAIITQYVSNHNIGFGQTQLGSILLKLVDVISASSSGLVDGTYNDISISGSGTAMNILADTVGNTEIANMPAWTIKVRNASTTGNPSDAALADITEEAAPASGDFLLGFLADGSLVVYDLANLPLPASLIRYTNGDATIVATGAGVTVTKDVTTGIWTIVVPSGVDIESMNITFANTDAEDATNHIYLFFDYVGARAYNLSYATLNMPQIRILPTTGTPSAGLPLSVTEGGNNTNDKSYGLYAPLGGGDGSDLNVKITNAPVASANLMLISFDNI